MRKGSKKENGKTRRFSTRLTESEYKEFSEKAEKTDYMLYLIKNDKI